MMRLSGVICGVTLSDSTAFLNDTLVAPELLFAEVGNALWALSRRGDIDPAGALNSPDYKIDGNMIMLLPLMQAVNSWTEKVREIEKTY